MPRDLRVLHVEDSADDAALVELGLRRAGFAPSIQRVETADEMRAALATPPDVILADDRLPRFDAASALALVRELGLDVPFIIVSGTIGEVRAAELVRRGAHDFVSKNDLGRFDLVISRELREAEDRAARRDAERRKEQFLAMIGHELRNPLAPIVTALELLRMRGADSDHEIAVIRRQVEHLQRLVDDLLDVARITRGDFPLRRGTVDLGEVVARAIEMASPLIDQRHHRLVVDAPLGQVFVDGDKDRLAQVVANLLTNAAKYTPPTGEIRVTAATDAECATISVADTGVGIPAELQPFVFEAFVQGKQTIDRGQGGLGLGLAIVKSLVALHGGEIALASTPGDGSTLTVRLPLIAGDQDTPPGAGARRHPTAPPDQRVLVVDDNVDAANLLAEFLGDLGYETVVAHDGPSALQAAAAHHPTLALLDIGLPVMDGYELGKQLKRDQPDLRMIAITGYGDSTDRRRSEQAGFEEHLVKPIDLDQLVSTLRS
jgi:signal transduction histidine kinase